MMGPDDERHEPEEDHGVDERFISPERLPGVVRDDFRDDSESGEDQHVDLRVREEPEEMLPEKRVPASAVGPHLAAYDKPRRKEEARSRDPVHRSEERRVGKE